MRGNVHSYSSIVREPLQSVKYRSGRDLCNIDTEKKCMLQEGIDQLFRALNHTDQSIRHRKPKFQSLEPMIHLFLLFFFSVKPVQDWHSRKHTERNAHF